MGSSDCGDVELDNGPAELCHQAPQEGKGVEARGVAAFEGDLQRVLPDQCDVVNPQLFIAQRFDAGESTCDPRFAATLRAWARPSQLLA